MDLTVDSVQDVSAQHVIGRRRELGLEGRDIETHEANEGRAVDDLDRPEAPPSLVEHTALGVDEFVGLTPRQRRQEVLHHFGIGIHLSPRASIGVAPLTQEKALGAELSHASKVTGAATTG